jgi:hypothetical protein
MQSNDARVAERRAMEILKEERPPARPPCTPFGFTEPFIAPSDPPVSEIALYLAAYRARHGSSPSGPVSGRLERPPALTAINGWRMFDPKLESEGSEWLTRPGVLDVHGRRRLAEAQAAFLASATDADLYIERSVDCEQASLAAAWQEEVEGETLDCAKCTEVSGDTQFNALGLESAAARAASEPHRLEVGARRVGGGRGVWGWGGCFGHTSPDSVWVPKSECE